MKRKILFVTGTRADFGKLKPLISAVKNSKSFEYQIFATGMHLLSKYGETVTEIYKSGFDNTFSYMNQVEAEATEIVLANTITGLSRYLHEHHVDMIIVHGDRVEALAGAAAGALRNILVTHIEGGEVSGSIDELMRHAISKLSHIHFVVNDKAKKRLRQLGEDPETIFKIGSPDVDAMLSDSLPSLDKAKNRYQILFEDYAVAMLHPVTTEYYSQYEHVEIFVDALLSSDQNYIVVYPNNDHGTQFIFDAYKRLEGKSNIKIFPSIRFEYFLVLLKNALFLIGNSSAGIHEAPIYGVPTINIGTRQNNRFSYESIYNVEFNKNKILDAIQVFEKHTRFIPCTYYGDGKSSEKFIDALNDKVWNISSQKTFKDI